MTANSDQIKRYKFELSIGKMDLDGPARSASSSQLVAATTRS